MPIPTPELHRRAVEAFGRHVASIGADQWGLPTPNAEWDVRALVNHVVGEALWTPPLMSGQTIADVGDRFDGDVLGDDPKQVWGDAAPAAVTAMEEPGAMTRTVHLSFGDVPGDEYAKGLFTDYLIHAWDLARAIGADERLNPDLVEASAAWFASVEENYRAAGMIGPKVDLPEGADAQARLLADFGRQP